MRFPSVKVPVWRSTMDAREVPRARSRRVWPIVSGAVALLTAAAFVFAQTASAATAFSANFEDGTASGWSKSGGTWAVVTDGSRVFQQSNAASENAREFAGST